MPVALQVVLVVLVIAVLTVVVLRFAVSRATREVALTRQGARQTGAEVVAAADSHGWQVRRGFDAQQTYPADLEATAITPLVCEQVVEGSLPRPFTAASWEVQVRRVGGAPLRGRDHLLTLPLTVAAPLPRFAVAGSRLRMQAFANLPAILLSFGGPDAGGVHTYGDDRGLRAWLGPVLPEVAEAEVWVVVLGDRLVLRHSGEPGPAVLARRIDLAARVAACLEAAVPA